MCRAHKDNSYSLRYWDKVTSKLNMVYKVREANQPTEHEIASLSCKRPPETERASFEISSRKLMPFQVETSASTSSGVKKSLSSEEIACELKKLVTKLVAESHLIRHCVNLQHNVFQMSRHLSIQHQIHNFSNVFGPFIFLSVGLVCILSVFLFYGVIRQGSEVLHICIYMYVPCIYVIADKCDYKAHFYLGCVFIPPDGLCRSGVNKRERQH